eukprot:GHVU01214250.1.p1 GENE.GHVU01214250.1~~GHVU01214250.1.p1  ORF type:complete len:467 (-),score=50.42 GHVU01214250.1:64-1464(-)
MRPLYPQCAPPPQQYYYEDDGARVIEYEEIPESPEGQEEEQEGEVPEEEPEEFRGDTMGSFRSVRGVLRVNRSLPLNYRGPGPRYVRRLEHMGMLSSTMVLQAWVGHRDVVGGVLLDSGASLPAISRRKCQLIERNDVKLDYARLASPRVFSLAVCGEVACAEYTVKLDIGPWMSKGVMVELKSIEFFVVEADMPNVLVGSNVLKALGLCPVDNLRAVCGVTDDDSGPARGEGTARVAISEEDPDFQRHLGPFSLGSLSLGSLTCPVFSMSQAVGLSDMAAPVDDEPLLILGEDTESESDGSTRDLSAPRPAYPGNEVQKIAEVRRNRMDECVRECAGLTAAGEARLRGDQEEFADIFRNRLMEGDGAALVTPMEVVLREGMFPGKHRLRKMGPALSHVVASHFKAGAVMGLYYLNKDALVASPPLVRAKGHVANDLLDVVPQASFEAHSITPRPAAPVLEIKREE